MLRLSLFRAGILLAIARMTGTCQAQSTPPQPEPTVVTVTGESTPISATAASVTVLPRQVIDESHAIDLAELLRQVPFLFLTQSGGRGGLTTVTLRGGKPNFTMVMLDGIPMNDITNVLGGSYDFSALSTDDVEQVEIVRGPLSSVYGSDAVAGVINIISRHGAGKATPFLDASLGAFATKQGRAGISGSIHSFDYAFSGSFQDIGEQVEKDRFRLGTLSFNTRLALGSRKLLSLVARYNRSRAAGFPINGGGPEYSIIRQPQSQNADEVLTGASWSEQVNTRWLYQLNVGFFRRGARAGVPAILDAPRPTFRSVPSSQTQTEFSRNQAGLWQTIRLRHSLDGTFTAGWRGERGSSAGLLANTIPDAFAISRNILDGAAELDYHTDRLTATAAVRGDKPLHFQAVASPRAGFSYRVRKNGPRVYSTWGRAFKLPSFYGLADPIIGNRLLRPEFSSSADLGLEQDLLRGRVRMSITGFHSTFRDLVDFSAQLFRLVNRSELRTRGVEIALRIPVSAHLEFGVRGSNLDWRLQQTTEPLRDQPRWQSGASLEWKPSPRWHSRLDTLWVGRRYDFSVPVPNQQSVGGYSVTNIVTGYAWSSKVMTYIRADNLFNAHFHEFIGFPNPGLWVKIGLTLRLR